MVLDCASNSMAPSSLPNSALGTLRAFVTNMERLSRLPRCLQTDGCFYVDRLSLLKYVHLELQVIFARCLSLCSRPVIKKIILIFFHSSAVRSVCVCVCVRALVFAFVRIQHSLAFVSVVCVGNINPLLPRACFMDHQLKL